jgi:hypothetical protein
VTKKLEAFGELDSFYAAGDSAAPQNYFVAGLVYFITNNCEIDFRVGASALTSTPMAICSAAALQSGIELRGQ